MFDIIELQHELLEIQREKQNQDQGSNSNSKSNNNYEAISPRPSPRLASRMRVGSIDSLDKNVSSLVSEGYTDAEDIAYILDVPVQRIKMRLGQIERENKERRAFEQLGLYALTQELNDGAGISIMS
jgi:hypothetical protein